MVTRNRVRCAVVSVGDSSGLRGSRSVLARDVLPWADPYVTQLITKLQEEVRYERRMQSLLRRRLSASFFAQSARDGSQLSGQEE
jgi:hypothetical protein